MYATSIMPKKNAMPAFYDPTAVTYKSPMNDMVKKKVKKPKKKRTVSRPRNTSRSKSKPKTTAKAESKNTEPVDPNESEVDRLKRLYNKAYNKKENYMLANQYLRKGFQLGRASSNPSKENVYQQKTAGIYALTRTVNNKTQSNLVADTNKTQSLVAFNTSNRIQTITFVLEGINKTSVIYKENKSVDSMIISHNKVTLTLAPLSYAMWSIN